MLLQGLGDLPEGLLIRVLRAASSSKPLAEQLLLLPSTFRIAGVFAAFPSIDAERSVCVDASDLECAVFARALWSALSRITPFRRNFKEGTWMRPTFREHNVFKVIFSR